MLKCELSNAYKYPPLRPLILTAWFSKLRKL
jgi:hypothetical protein